jgi:hypothetical protein
MSAGNLPDLTGLSPGEINTIGDASRLNANMLAERLSGVYNDRLAEVGMRDRLMNSAAAREYNAGLLEQGAKMAQLQRTTEARVRRAEDARRKAENKMQQAALKAQNAKNEIDAQAAKAAHAKAVAELEKTEQAARKLELEGDEINQRLQAIKAAQGANTVDEIPLGALAAINKKLPVVSADDTRQALNEGISSLCGQDPVTHIPNSQLREDLSDADVAQATKLLDMAGMDLGRYHLRGVNDRPGKDIYMIVPPHEEWTMNEAELSEYLERVRHWNRIEDDDPIWIYNKKEIMDGLAKRRESMY